MITILVSITALISTVLGGLFALKYKDRLHLIMGFTSGVILGVVGFDIFPEIMELVKSSTIDATVPMMAFVIGFLLFHILEKLVLIHHTHEEDYVSHTHPHVGVLSAIALICHSFLDGVGIGIGFQVNILTGLFVTLAVVGHDFADGLNTVTLMLTHKNTDKKALYFLLLDALAPVLGAISTLLFVIPKNYLGVYLGYFAGILMYIGASDILPEAHRKKRSVWTIALTVFGTFLVFVLTKAIKN